MAEGREREDITMAQDSSLSFNLGLPQIPETQDKALYPELVRVYNAINVLARGLDSFLGSVSPPVEDWPEITPEMSLKLQNFSKVYCQFDVAVPLGAAVNLYNVGGVLHAKLAKADSATTPCHGFCSVLLGVVAGAFGEVTLAGANIFLGGVIPGARYFLSNTSTTGQVQNLPPSSGIVQPIGFGLSSTTIWWMPTLLLTASP